MRRGNFVKNQGPPKAAVGVDLITDKQVAKRNTVEEVLAMFKKGNRDIPQAMKIIREGENGDRKGMQQSLEQLSDMLCSVGYFGKAMELLEQGLKEVKDDPILHELIARVAFIMENFEKCITHNKKAAELQPQSCYHNNSDIGLAYYRLGLQQGQAKHFETAFGFLRKSLQ